jgi:hypothetical protein
VEFDYPAIKQTFLGSGAGVHSSAPRLRPLHESPELKSSEIPDEIPALQGRQLTQLRVLARIYLNGSCGEAKMSHVS